MVYVWIGMLSGMMLLGAALANLSMRMVRDRRVFDLELTRYEPRHAVTVPRETPDPWAAILRLPEPSPEPSPDTVTLPKLTDTGELRVTKTRGELKAITDAWIAKHCPVKGL